MKAARDHQVKHGVEVPLEIQDDAFSHPMNAHDGSSRELADRRVERSQQERRGEPNSEQSPPADAASDVLDVHLDVGELGHGFGDGGYSMLDAMRRALGVLLVLAACAPCACKSTPPPRPQQAWSAPLDQSHPLVGKIWDPARHAAISQAELFRRLDDADYVLLGESHDNPDHHRLQAQALGAVLAHGRRPVLAWEMLEPRQQPLVDAFFAHEQPIAAFGEAVQWARGWPPWPYYVPIARVAADANLRFVAANIPEEDARAIARGERTPALPLLEPERERDLVDEIVESHCGHVSRERAASMALAQRTRDAHMADVLLGEPAAVLVAGAGHVRTDRGVPFYLRAKRPEAHVLGLAFVEVAIQAQSPDAYAREFHAGTLPFDFVWFTPRMRRDDPCAALLERIQK
jgi:uncharacterized iron-regulated protein